MGATTGSRSFQCVLIVFAGIDTRARFVVGCVNRHGVRCSIKLFVNPLIELSFTNMEINIMAKKTVDLETQTVTFDFGDGRVETFQLSDCSDEMKIQLALHGASQKTGDSYASAKSQTEDTDIDPSVWSQGQAAGVIAQLYADDWTVRTPGTAAATDLATALAEAVGCELQQAVDRLAETEKDEKSALRKHPDVAIVLARIKSERAAAKLATAETKEGTGPDLTEFMVA